MPSSARLFQLLIVVLFTGSAFVWLVPSSSKVTLRPSAWSSHSESASIGPEDLTRLYEEHRQARLKDYEPKVDEDEFRYRGLDPSLEAYVLRLRTFVLEAFPSHLQPPLLRSIERVERQLPPDPSRPEMSRKIYTTNKDKNDVPEIFNEWKKLHESWTIDVLDDEGMDDWVEGYFGKGGAANEMGPVWRALPKIVLKSDTLRYLIMLLEGGVYSDSDTMPTSPILNWGHDYDAQRIVDLPLKLISNLHSGLVDSNFHGHDSHADADALRHPLSDPTVSGVVGIEIDITRSTEPDFVKHWFARLVQFTQWTLAFKPYHPIYIDLLETIYRKAVQTDADLASGKITHEQIEDTLNFTGPGPYTDAVYRYFLVHLGIRPHDTFDVSGPFRVGDIILLSQYGFSQPVDPKDRNEWGAVHHDFAGRWRHDG